MTKRILSAALSVLLIVLLCACTGNEVEQSAIESIYSLDNNTSSVDSEDSGNEQSKDTSSSPSEDSSEDEMNIDAFKNDREAFKTDLVIKYPAPQDYDEDIKLPKGVQEITFRSGELELKAWLSKAPADGKKHPAVVFAHGGFAFGDGDWADAKRYLDAGFVLMTPMLRGENGNPGNFELFYGEVDDIIAAAEYLKTLSYVDADNIFLAGFCVGGNIALLVSMLPSPYKAIATIGACADTRDFVVYFEPKPFRRKSKEYSMRDSLNYIKCIQKPLLLYAGDDEDYYELNEEFEANALQLGKDCVFIPIAGDHFEAYLPSIENSVERFLEMLE